MKRTAPLFFLAGSPPDYLFYLPLSTKFTSTFFPKCGILAVKYLPKDNPLERNEAS